MKLSKLKENLQKKYKVDTNSKKRLKRVKENLRKNKDEFNTDNLKVIGITGSVGKSTTAVIVHEYLKSLGYKSVLYSTAKIDSPASIIKPDEACEISFNTEEELLNIIEETEAYGADYLVLEINDSTIEKGLIKEIPFTVRALTTLNPTHNLEHYTKEEYVKLKKSFFENIDNNCKCVYGFQGYDKTLLEELIKLNDCEKMIYTSKHIASVNNVNYNIATCLLEELNSTLKGLKMLINVNGVSYELETKIMMSYNSLNILGAVTILEALNVFDIKEFQKCIYNVKIPGRAEVYKTKGRMVVIDAHLPRMLECLYDFKKQGAINRVKVVLGSTGHGFKTWSDRFKTDNYLNQHSLNKKAAMEYIKKYADFAYLTENDNGADNVLDICLELQGYLNGQVPSTIIEDREEAIRKAIQESKIGDVIFISGRGNRRLLCNTATSMKLLKDSEVVKQVFKEMGW